MIYFFDGSESGFLTAFLAAFHDQNAIVTSKRTQMILGQEPVFIHTDEGRANKAKARLYTFDKHAAHDLSLLLRCGDEDNEQTAFLYLRFLALQKRSVRNMLAETAVFDAMATIKRVGLEIHHLHGFIRFMETQSGALYAPFSPDHDICDLLLPHFRARFSSYPFVLHDVSRKKPPYTTASIPFSRPLKRRTCCYLPTSLRGRGFGNGITPRSISPRANDSNKCADICPCGIGNLCPKRRIHRPFRDFQAEKPLKTLTNGHILEYNIPI